MHQQASRRMRKRSYNALTGEVLVEQADRYTYPAQQGQTDSFRID